MNVPHRPWIAALALALVPPSTARAERPLVVKLATLAPDGSAWTAILKDMGARWTAASGGRVVLRVYPGGVAGDEPDVVRKMRAGTLQASAMTAVGLAEIVPDVHAMSVPLLYDGDDEAAAVLERLRPRLEAAFEAKGFVVLNWADVGWTHFFTRTPVAAPDDLRALRLFTWAGDPRTTEVWRGAGFDPVPLPSTEVGAALESGAVGAVGCSPQLAIVARYHDHAPYMTDLRWQLLLGATIVSRAVWEQVPADVRPALAEAAADAGRRLRASTAEGAGRDVEAMKTRGLRVVPVSSAAAWRRLAEQMYPRIRGGIVPGDAFDEAVRLRDAYRRRGSSAMPSVAEPRMVTLPSGS